MSGAPKTHKRASAMLRDWRNTVGNLIEYFWTPTSYHGPQFAGVCVERRGVQFHRIQDFKQYYSNSIPPTFQECAHTHQEDDMVVQLHQHGHVVV